MPFRACKVSFVERGQQHIAHVDAETVYEAACLALKQFKLVHRLQGPAPTSMLLIETAKPAALLVECRVADVLRWLYKTRSSTADTEARKKRLRALLADDRR